MFTYLFYEGGALRKVDGIILLPVQKLLLLFLCVIEMRRQFYLSGLIPCKCNKQGKNQVLSV